MMITTPTPRETLTPTQIAIALLLKELHRGDDACGRAVDTLLGKPDLPPLRAFTGVEARFQSDSEPELENVVTVNGCSCRGGRHPWCVHRARFRVLLAEAALRDPASVLRPHPWPTEAPRYLPEAALPASLGDGRPRSVPSPVDPDVQREIDELWPPR